ncbi:MAG: Acyl-CoA:1-acyl-sn-glycerol-3-phosphate acyltransferase, partial [uncultured Friedmanniella sp.]
ALLGAEVVPLRPRDQGGLPALDRGEGERSVVRAGDPGLQPHLRGRHLPDPRADPAPADLPRQGRGLRGDGAPRPGAQVVPRGRRHAADGPLRGPGQRHQHDGRARRAGAWRPARHLPRGHPLAGRPAAQGQDRRGPAGAAGPGAGAAGRRGRHAVRPAAAAPDPGDAPPRRPDRRAPRLRPLRRRRQRPRRAAVRHRRDHGGRPGALRPDLRRRLRLLGEERGRRGPAVRDHGARAARRRTSRAAGPRAPAASRRAGPSV